MIDIFKKQLKKKLNKKIEIKNERLAAEKFCRFGEQYQKSKLEYYIDKYYKTLDRMGSMNEAVKFLVEKVGI